MNHQVYPLTCHVLMSSHCLCEFARLHRWQSSLHWCFPYVKKHTLVQALRLCTGLMAHRGRRGIALDFLDHGTRRRWGVSVTPLLLFTPEKDLAPFLQEAGLAPGPVWTGAENLTPTGIRSPDRPARSQLLYWLSYPAHIAHWWQE